MKRNSALPTLVILLCLLFASLQMAPLLDLSNQQHLEDFTARRIFTKISVQQQPSFLVDDTRHIEPSMDSTIVEAPNAPGASSQIWQVECVACPDRFGLASDRNLRLDSTGHPHIVYGGDRLFYARYDGANWRHDTVDSGPYVGEFAALALDANDDPHIAYLDWEHSAVRYARWTGVDWVVQTAVNGESAGGFVSLVLDHNNDPVISYHDRGDLTLRVARWTAAGWAVQIVDQVATNFYGINGSSASNSLVMDSSGRPAISYFGSSSTLNYAFWNGSVWVTQEVAEVGANQGAFTSLALGNADAPHISFTTWDEGLGYAYWTGSAWIIQKVDSVGGFNSIALDDDGVPHISYDTNGLRYARWSDGAWDVQMVAGAGGQSSLALDSDGNPYIAFIGIESDGTGINWTLARWTGTVWDQQVVDNAEPGAAFGSLVLDVAGNPHAVYVNHGSSGLGSTLQYAYLKDSAWNRQTVDSAISAVLSLDSTGRPYIVYYRRNTSYPEALPSIMVAYQIGDTWVTEQIDEGSADGYALSIVLDAFDHPHITYFGPPGAGLLYTHWTGAEWETRSVDRAALYDASLTLDAEGHPHIAYFDGVNQDLHYTYWTGDAWDTQTVDSMGNTGRFPSLALDANGQPHISYHDATHWDLKYAQWTGSTWDIQTVDRWGDGQGTALALDANDSPHISYISYGQQEVRYAYRVGNGWVVRTIDRGHALNWRTSLALDTANRPHIGYGDTWPIENARHAWLVSAPSLDKQASPVDGVEVEDSVTYTLTVSGPGLSLQLLDSLPDSVRFVSGSLSTDILPAAVYSPTAHAISWQGTLISDTVQMIQFQVTPIEEAPESSLSAPIVNTAWLTDVTSNQSVSATVIVNSKRSYLPLLMR
jgi:hypothetical protein